MGWLAYSFPFRERSFFCPCSVPKGGFVVNSEIALRKYFLFRYHGWMNKMQSRLIFSPRNQKADQQIQEEKLPEKNGNKGSAQKYRDDIPLKAVNRN
jgi:hypothetical protein